MTPPAKDYLATYIALISEHRTPLARGQVRKQTHFLGPDESFPRLETVMTKLSRPLILPLLLFLTGFSLSAADESVPLPDTMTSEELAEVIREVDELYRSRSSFAQIEMAIETAHWERTLSMEAYSQGTERTLIRITYPRREAGVTTLRLGNEMWNYLPKTDKTIKIPPSMMMGSWMGSDFTNDDLVRQTSLIDDYQFEVFTPDDASASVLYVRCLPSDDLTIVWSEIHIAVDRISRLPVWQRYFDDDGSLVRTLTFSDVTRFGDRDVPATMTMTPHTEEGRQTVITYQMIDFTPDFESDLFSLRSLRTR